MIEMVASREEVAHLEGGNRGNRLPRLQIK